MGVKSKSSGKSVSFFPSYPYSQHGFVPLGGDST
jgi:hypothetical protein